MSVRGAGAAPSGGVFGNLSKAKEGMLKGVKAEAADAINKHPIITAIGLAAISTLLLLGMAGIIPLPYELLTSACNNNIIAVATSLSAIAVLGLGFVVWSYKNREKSKGYKIALIIAALVVGYLAAGFLCKDQRLLDFSSYGPITANVLAIGTGMLAFAMGGSVLLKNSRTTTNKVAAVGGFLLFSLGLTMACSAAYTGWGPGGFVLTTAASLILDTFCYKYAKKLFNKKANAFAGLHRKHASPPVPVIGRPVDPPPPVPDYVPWQSPTPAAWASASTSPST